MNKKIQHPAHAIPLTVLKGVGPQLSARFEKLGIQTLQDLLLHFPFRYQDRTRLTPVARLQLHQDAVIEGDITACQLAFGKRRSLVCSLQDDSGIVNLRFFHFSMAQKKQLESGVRVRCYGEPRRGARGLEFYHPEYRIINDDNDADEMQETLTPVYPVTEGLQQNRLRKLIADAFEYLRKHDKGTIYPDLMPLKPSGIEAIENWLDSLYNIHFPKDLSLLASLQEAQHPVQKALVFEELLAHHFALLKIRKEIQVQKACCLKIYDEAESAFLSRLPFELTRAQRRVIGEIQADLGKPYPMLRLVQGDVGSGKTLVAAAAVEQALKNGLQVALMAPTELLAEQHYKNFTGWLGEAWPVMLLVGSTRQAQRKSCLQALAENKPCLVIGTHALFQADVSFARLGLVIIDEQHRFGVHQRLLLNQKGEVDDHVPHQLVMTATPIPRTLAMSAYADLDCSVIDELPKNRKPITTVLVEKSRRNSVVERVAAACEQGRQVYWVCTLIEASENLQAQAAENTYQELAEGLGKLRVGLVHGRMAAAEKNRVMDAFKQGDIDLLVATTVIEVGVDVPNASLMVIENPERLGLAQLHQLRGRVGRGTEESHCVLLYEKPLSEYSRARLSIMRETSDGFRIAEEDLRLRGPGEVLGTRQTGELQFRMADIQRDAYLLDEVRHLAKRYEEECPTAIEPIIKRWLGNSEQFARA